MPTYEYRCARGHVTERVQSMADDVPATVPCEDPHVTLRVDFDDDARSSGCVIALLDGEQVRSSRFSGDTCGERVGAAMRRVGLACGELAKRVFTAPAAIHFRGPGFYETDYRGKYDRKRRPNAGDDLPIPEEAAITRAEGAEYDPPASIPGGVIQRA